MPDEASKSTSPDQKALQTILVVEDDEAIGELFERTIMSETSYAVIVAADAGEALEAVKTILPGLFILDFHLPGMNGVELHDRLHAIKGLETVPTLMISSNRPAQSALRQRHISFLKKPFDLTDLLQAIEQHLPSLDKKKGS